MSLHQGCSYIISKGRDRFNPESDAALEATLLENPLRKPRLLKVIMLKMLNVPLEEASLGSLRLPIPRVFQHDPTHKIPHSQAKLPHVTRLATWALQTCPMAQNNTPQRQPTGHSDTERCVSARGGRGFGGLRALSEDSEREPSTTLPQTLTEIKREKSLIIFITVESSKKTEVRWPPPPCDSH